MDSVMRFELTGKIGGALPNRDNAGFTDVFFEQAPAPRGVLADNEQTQNYRLRVPNDVMKPFLPGAEMRVSGTVIFGQAEFERKNREAGKWRQDFAIFLAERIEEAQSARVQPAAKAAAG